MKIYISLMYKGSVHTELRWMETNSLNLATVKTIHRVFR